MNVNQRKKREMKKKTETTIFPALNYFANKQHMYIHGKIKQQP